MSSRLRHEITAVFDTELEASPQIHEWVFHETKSRRPKRNPYPRLAAAAAALLVVASAGYYAYRFGIPFVTPATPVPTALPDGAYLSVGAFTSGETGWIVRRQPGNPGKPTLDFLYQTTDGGATWKQRLQFDGEYDGMVFSPDGKKGVVWAKAPDAGPVNRPGIVGSIFHWTTDGGASWQTAGGPGVMEAATFGDTNVGWLLTTNATGGRDLFSSHNSGATWQPLAHVTYPGWQSYGTEYGTYERALQFADLNHGWLVPNSYNPPSVPALLATQDGGASWRGVTLTLPAGMDGEISAGQPVLFGDGSGILPVEVRAPATDPTAPEAPSQLLVYTSTDNGATWGNPRPLFPTGSPQAGTRLVGAMGIWDFMDAKHWWVMNQTGTGGGPWAPRPQLLVTSDAGRTWKTYDNAPDISDIHFTDVRNGWAEDQTFILGIGNVNGLIRTTDGGAHWTRVALPRG